jgi:hypothetical protein
VELPASCDCVELPASCDCVELPVSCDCVELPASCDCVELPASCDCVELPASCDSTIRRLCLDYVIWLRAINVRDKESYINASSSEIYNQPASSLCV